MLIANPLGQKPLTLNLRFVHIVHAHYHNHYCVLTFLKLTSYNLIWKILLYGRWDAWCFQNVVGWNKIVVCLGHCKPKFKVWGDYHGNYVPINMCKHVVKTFVNMLWKKMYMENVNEVIWKTLERTVILEKHDANVFDEDVFFTYKKFEWY